MTKGENKAKKRREIRKAIKRSDIQGHGKMLGTLVQHGYGGGVVEGVEVETLSQKDEDE